MVYIFSSFTYDVDAHQALTFRRVAGARPTHPATVVLATDALTDRDPHDKRPVGAARHHRRGIHQFTEHVGAVAVRGDDPKRARVGIGVAVSYFFTNGHRIRDDGIHRISCAHSRNRRAATRDHSARDRRRTRTQHNRGEVRGGSGSAGEGGT